MESIACRISVSSFVPEFPFEQIIDIVLIIILMFNNFDYVSPKLTELKLKKSKIEHEILEANLRLLYHETHYSLNCYYKL